MKLVIGLYKYVWADQNLVCDKRERERETTTGVVFTVYSGIVISFASCYLFCSFAGNRECVIAVSGVVVCGKFFLLLNM